MSLPDFLIIGAPKAGTTALHAALTFHPELQMAAVKEPKFYLSDGTRPRPQPGPGDAHSVKEWIWRREDYEQLFDNPSGLLTGESTPFYLYDLEAQRRIQAEIPDAKLIVVLRDPIDRAHSNWAHLRSDGLEPVADFLTACWYEEERLAAGWAPFWHYLRLGRYGEQVEHLLTVFPREQVHLLRYRELVDDPGATLDKITDFLGVEPGLLTTVPRENTRGFVGDSRWSNSIAPVVRAGARAGALFPPEWWRKASVPLLWTLQRGSGRRPSVSIEDRRALVEYYRDDIRRLERVTGISYGDWLTERSRGDFMTRSEAAEIDERLLERVGPAPRAE
jgi:hypothetical protein